MWRSRLWLRGHHYVRKHRDGANPDTAFLEVPMLVDLYPRVHRRYTLLAIIGPILDGYGTWLLKQGYSTERAREHFQAAPRLLHPAGRRGGSAPSR